VTLLERINWIVSDVERASITFADEYDLQAGIQHALEATGNHVAREVRLGDGVSRIDLIVTCGIPNTHTIGIEVKVDGAYSDVLRQLTRYAKEPTIDALILVTSRSKHHHIPLELNGKPVRLVSMIGAGL
jgi:hypothetical protein